jgi:ubiquinone/menaquinone biosynthesis C-methylase UbiE
MRVNLGSGKAPKDGYINCDNNPKAKAFADAKGCQFRFLDVLDSLPWDDASLDEVLCENLFDSLSHTETTKLLREIYRVLRPAGVIKFHLGDVAVNPDMCIGWPFFKSGYTRYFFNYFTIGEPAHENWKDYWNLPGFDQVEIVHNDSGIMLGSMRKPQE